jgi:hypothetical protein
MHLNSWAVWAVYTTGQILHILLSANLSVHSKLNSVDTFGRYFKLRWIPLLCRLFLTTLTFVIAWDNPSIMSLDSRFLPAGGTQIALAGFMGWAADSIFDKVIAVIPGLSKELPGVDFPPAKSSTEMGKE